MQSYSILCETLFSNKDRKSKTNDSAFDTSIFTGLSLLVMVLCFPARSHN